VPRTPQPTTAHSDAAEDTLMADEILPRNKTVQTSVKIVRSNRSMVEEDGCLSWLFNDSSKKGVRYLEPMCNMVHGHRFSIPRGDWRLMMMSITCFPCTSLFEAILVQNSVKKMRVGCVQYLLSPLHFRSFSRYK
jgi:hypothetical protein